MAHWFKDVQPCPWEWSVHGQLGCRACQVLYEGKPVGQDPCWPIATSASRDLKGIMLKGFESVQFIGLCRSTLWCLCLCMSCTHWPEALLMLELSGAWLRTKLLIAVANKCKLFDLTNARWKNYFASLWICHVNLCSKQIFRTDHFFGIATLHLTSCNGSQGLLRTEFVCSSHRPPCHSSSWPGRGSHP